MLRFYRMLRPLWTFDSDPGSRMILLVSMYACTALMEAVLLRDNTQQPITAQPNTP